MSSSTVSSISDANQGRQLIFGINGRVQDLDRKVSSVEFNSARFLDLGIGEVFRADAVKFGARFSREKLNSLDQRQGAPGIDTSNISDAFITSNVLSAVQNA